MTAPITKADARKALDLENDTQLAEIFGCSKQAVSAWGDDDEPLPPARQWELRAKHPDKFPMTDESEKDKAA